MTLRLDIFHHFVNPICSSELPAALADITTKIDQIMSAIADFANKVNTHNDKIEAALSELGDDINGLKDTIAELQGTTDEISEDDQKLLDAIEERAASLAAKVDAMNALTPPKAPVV